MNDLKVTIENPTEIKMTRTFDAPRHLVRRAMTEPALLKRWLGNCQSPVVSVDNDFRVGGTYRQLFRTNDGVEFTFTGVYQEITDERTVMTQRFNDSPDEALAITTLTERDGKTELVIVMRFGSQAVRDMVIATGMEHGARASYANLEQLIRAL
jgi:uncharacterized protein YndB with AHSA1/START domain